MGIPATFSCSQCPATFVAADVGTRITAWEPSVWQCPECEKWQAPPPAEPEAPAAPAAPVVADVTPREVLRAIYYACQSPQEMLEVAAVLDTKASFIAGLEGRNYMLARYKVVESCAEGMISEDLRDRILACIPAADA